MYKKKLSTIHWTGFLSFALLAALPFVAACTLEAGIETLWKEVAKPTFVEVTGVTGIPTTGVAGLPVSFSDITVEPSNATKKTITKIEISADSAAWTDADSVTAHTFTAEGTYYIKVTIADGTAVGTDFVATETITIGSFISVDSVDLPSTGAVNIEYNFNDFITVNPPNASKKTITKLEFLLDGKNWVDDAGDIIIAIGNIHTFDAEGIYKIRVTIADGLGVGADYVSDGTDEIVIVSFVPVTGITGLPTTGTAGIPVSFSAVVGTPSTANTTAVTKIEISADGNAWDDADSLAAHTFTGAGTYYIRVTVANGEGEDQDYVTDGSDTIVITAAPVYVTAIGITVDPTAVAGAQFSVSADLDPGNPDDDSITWEYKLTSDPDDDYVTLTVTNDEATINVAGEYTIKATAVGSEPGEPEVTATAEIEIIVASNPVYVTGIEITVDFTAVVDVPFNASAVLDPLVPDDDSITWEYRLTSETDDDYVTLTVISDEATIDAVGEYYIRATANGSEVTGAIFDIATIEITSP